MRSWRRGRAVARRHGFGVGACCTPECAQLPTVTSSVDAAVVWHTIGTIREELSDFDGADTAYQLATAILNRHSGDDALTPVRITVASSTGRLARAFGRLDDAERLYAVTIQLAERHFGADTVEVAGLLNDLAVAHKYAGRFDEAEALYRRALPIIEVATGIHVDVATIWHNLGGIEHARGRFGVGRNLDSTCPSYSSSLARPDSCGGGEGHRGAGCPGAGTGTIRRSRTTIQASGGDLRENLRAGAL